MSQDDELNVLLNYLYQSILLIDTPGAFVHI